MGKIVSLFRVFRASSSGVELWRLVRVFITPAYVCKFKKARDHHGLRQGAGHSVSQSLSAIQSLSLHYTGGSRFYAARITPYHFVFVENLRYSAYKRDGGTEFLCIVSSITPFESLYELEFRDDEEMHLV
ncbi:hypothetical protein AVEN_274704-1 [Araneus ventricosus]|uniref:Uncharacterized protein n=1 Tax=Araneus ventricosus TaxID=182803 RepID=A0A4Y2TEE7_ARAVE|nr:hypothetical protein AVEN_274704-1 [Araneus ventricosus]